MAVEIKSGDILPIESFSKHLKINAGPGAGKTHFLVENVKNLVRNHPSIEKSRVRKIACITYTNAAVEEIKRRLNKFADSVEAYTIHGFIIENIIKPFQQDLKHIIEDAFSITVNPKGKITSQIEGLGILHGEDKDDIYKFITDCTSEQIELSYSKRIMGDIEVDNALYLSTGEIKLKASNKVSQQHRLPIKEYVWSKVKKLTHNEILFFGHEILKRNPTALYATRVRFPFIFIDEFQDTNPLQTKLIRLIGQKSTIIGIIGDIAQSIYSFQGARPQQFRDFSIEGDRDVIEYEIKGNRRSITNIVNYCNFLRCSDTLVQNSIKPYGDENAKALAEAKKVCFMMGESQTIKEKIKDLMQRGAVVLTRTWAAAFTYIQDISDAQNKLLKDIYNSYYTSPIDIRAEITEIHNVTWVRAFKFIFMLWDAYKTGSFIDAIRAISLYSKIDKATITPKLVVQIKNMSEKIFAAFSESVTTVSIINTFNTLLQETDFTELKNKVFGDEFSIFAFSEFDDDKLITAVSGLDWRTSYKLFNEVFTKESKFMTVHQAKGLEWEKVIVSVAPSSRNDKTTLAKMYNNPQILDEKPEEEFTRMYYVACSRAEEELYIHIVDSDLTEALIKNVLSNFVANKGIQIDYEIIH